MICSLIKQLCDLTADLCPGLRLQPILKVLFGKYPQGTLPGPGGSDAGNSCTESTLFCRGRNRLPFRMGPEGVVAREFIKYVGYQSQTFSWY